MDNKYCYPNCHVLKNKLNITDTQTLFQAELELTAKRLLELQLHPVKGNFDFKHLCQIHQRIFQDLYNWAGRPRTVDIAKSNLFCLVQNIQEYASDIFQHYYPDCLNTKDNPKQFVHILTQHYADLNALHPFREGNGRSQREFTRELCLQCGYIFDLTHTSQQEMLTASIESFNGNNTKLETIFQTAILPIDNIQSSDKDDPQYD